MRTRNEATRGPDPAARSWSVTDDYLADPAVAPLRALVAAVARRVASRRDARSGGTRGHDERRRTSSFPSPRRPQPA